MERGWNVAANTITRERKKKKIIKRGTAGKGSETGDVKRKN